MYNNRRRKINMVIDQIRQFTIILIELSHTQTGRIGVYTRCVKTYTSSYSLSSYKHVIFALFYANILHCF